MNVSTLSAKRTFRLFLSLSLSGLAACAGCSHNSANGVDTIAQAQPVKPTATPHPTPTPMSQRAVPNWAKAHIMRRVPVKPGQKVFALTFDDGPWPKYTRQVLQVLKENNVHATFFMVGQEVSRRPQIAREVRDAGHAIGNHSWDHPSRPRDAKAQVTRTDAAIKKAIGYTPTFFRPPYGLLKNGMARQAMNEGDPVFLWSADCADWKKPGADHIARMIIGQATPGGISLMHDGGGNRSQSVAALPIIIASLRAKGYRFVTIPELLKLRWVAPKKPKSLLPAKPQKNTHAKKTSTQPVMADKKPVSHNGAAKTLKSPQAE